MGFSQSGGERRLTTPSTPKDRHGCSDSSTAISGVSDRVRKGYLSL